KKPEPSRIPADISWSVHSLELKVRMAKSQTIASLTKCPGIRYLTAAHTHDHIVREDNRIHGFLLLS
ncbi:MAG: hypothetical protein J5947_03795, partial [Clostridium sp.]|nr:hypothetical protein [Clostridium sp.]